MCAKMAFQHQAGTAMECLSVRIFQPSLTPLSNMLNCLIKIPITLHKEFDGYIMRCGFKIGGGIDQDYRKSPQGYTDNVRNYPVYSARFSPSNGVMTLHWWMHWFWITYQIFTCFSSMVTIPMHSGSVEIRQTTSIPNVNVSLRAVGALKYIPPTTTMSTAFIPNSTVAPLKQNKSSKKYDFHISSTKQFLVTTVNPQLKLTTVIDQNITDVGTNITDQTSFNNAINIAGNITYVNENDANRSIITNSELVEAKNLEIPTSSLTAAGITGITLGCVSIIGVICAVSFIMYRNYGFNRLQVLNDRCSNPDSSGYIDDSTVRENSEEMYSLDNDSFLNSLEAMTIQNLWTDSVKHTKL
ncbi:hypothetical protein FQR65_LT13517 [Abscondita terminalis]|nr:hypothetical protein FQR65_LT13517 [Abscondita terminalis]